MFLTVPTFHVGIGLNVLMSMYVYIFFPGGSVVKNLPTNTGDCRFNPCVGRFPLEKEMAIHSIILAWEIQWTEEPGELHAVHEGAKELDTT